MMGLTLDPHPARGLRAGPRSPTVFPRGPGKPVQFDSLAALARKVHALRTGGGLRLAPGLASYDGSDTFPVLKLFVIDADDTERFAAALAVQGASAARLAEAIAAANPDTPEQVAA